MARAPSAATVTAKPRTRRPKAAPTPEPQAKPSSSKTAVVVIHGIGEQTPLETLRGFVETVYRRDRSLASLPVGDNGMLDVSVVPDDVTGSAELRRITTLNDGPQKRTDFFEFYWADIMDGTPVDMVTGWIRTLVLRSPWRLPASPKVVWAWGILAGIFAIFTAAGLVSAGFGVAQLTDGRPPNPALDAQLACIRNWVAGVMVGGGLLWFIINCLRAGFQMHLVTLKWPLRLAAAGLVLWAVPATLLGSLPFWAAGVAALAGWALHSAVTPFAGDVVRYVRATPSTVERRRLVRERGVALLEALHQRRADGSKLEAFTQAGPNDPPPLYDRIVLVGHSLGTIIAYDLLQLFWEKYGPTHHQSWDFEDQDIQSALRDCDALVQAAWDQPPRSVDAADLSAVQDRLFDKFSRRQPFWRISDLITLGSPLTHAEFLLADTKNEIEDGCKERRFATAPPHPDVTQDRQNTMLHLAPGADARTSQGEPAMVPHFAAQFSTVRWTNIYDEENNPLAGDLISGSLIGNFGPAIAEHRVVMKRLNWPGFLQRVFTHTQYWVWHQSYEPEEAKAAEDDVTKPIEDRRDLLWHNVPQHIVLLRRALRLGQ
ncbi:hypothetical protein SAMN05428969_2153 [Devosia sp. YR412]|uniref:hypothetical protein n=1 Tax=Devosia sp. YR412 TaxID=1881030 RepID=UPI0008B574CC|nr:hypothetical protein [Devosia sp. YR412]SEQ13930.1 hypothetical protein SAMN05428969_2153 [Devosia sp. YR412]